MMVKLIHQIININASFQLYCHLWTNVTSLKLTCTKTYYCSRQIGAHSFDLKKIFARNLKKIIKNTYRQACGSNPGHKSRHTSHSVPFRTSFIMTPCKEENNFFLKFFYRYKSNVHPHAFTCTHTHIVKRKPYRNHIYSIEITTWAICGKQFHSFAPKIK